MTNTGNVTLSGVTLVDDQEGTLTLSDNAGDGVGVLAVGDTETASSSHTLTQADIDAGSLTNIVTANGTSPLGVGVQDTDTQTVKFVDLSLSKTSAVTQVTGTLVNTASLSADNGTAPPDASTTDIGVVLHSVITYSLTVTNDGDADAANVVLIDTLPAGLAITANPDGGTIVGNTITWTFANVGANCSVSVSVTAKTQYPSVLSPDPLQG